MFRSSRHSEISVTGRVLGVDHSLPRLFCLAPPELRLLLLRPGGVLEGLCLAHRPADVAPRASNRAVPVTS
jgi:hypothetical protein